MRIFYAVQATGNGHISRANQIVPFLERHGEVDVLLSGSNFSLKPEFEVAFLSKGVSLFYNRCGSVNMTRTVFSNSLAGAVRDARSLPLEKYDLIINDFDLVTSLACKFSKRRSVHFGHQASFTSSKVPRPAENNLIGEFILKYYAQAPIQVGLHFKSYDEGIFPPIIKDSVIRAQPRSNGHITVYLPSVDQVCIYNSLKRLPNLKFHWFTHDVQSKRSDGNIELFPIDNKNFTESMIICDGLITGGGFETPSEALFMEKRLLSIPIGQHFEQQCNAAALEEMGVPVLHNPDYSNLDEYILKWVENPQDPVRIEKADTKKLVDYIVNTQSSNPVQV